MRAHLLARFELAAAPFSWYSFLRSFVLIGAVVSSFAVGVDDVAFVSLVSVSCIGWVFWLRCSSDRLWCVCGLLVFFFFFGGGGFAQAG